MKLMSLFGRSESPAAAARRRAAERLPAAPKGEAYWLGLRTPARPQDLALSPVALRWLRSLPSSARPKALAEGFPRIVNRLALCWRDPALTARVFDELMVVRRGSRRGFPPAVSAEILRLREHSARHRHDEDSHHWDAQSLATADR